MSRKTLIRPAVFVIFLYVFRMFFDRLGVAGTIVHIPAVADRRDGIGRHTAFKNLCDPLILPGGHIAEHHIGIQCAQGSKPLLDGFFHFFLEEGVVFAGEAGFFDDASAFVCGGISGKTGVFRAEFFPVHIVIAVLDADGFNVEFE